MGDTEKPGLKVKKGAEQAPEKAYDEILEEQREAVKQAVQDVIAYFEIKGMSLPSDNPRTRGQMLGQLTSLFILRDVLEQGKPVPENLPKVVGDIVILTNEHIAFALNENQKERLQKAVSNLNGLKSILDGTSEEKDVA